MRTVIRVLLVGTAVGLAISPVAADGPDRTGDLDAAARAFVKAFHAKDIDALTATTDAPFFVGTFRSSKTLQSDAQVRAELKSRLARGQFPTKVAKTLTWDRAIGTGLSPAEERTTREKIKAAVDVTGEDGGYAALGDPVGGKRSSSVAVSELRLLVGMRDGRAKVVGILKD